MTDFSWLVETRMPTFVGRDWREKFWWIIFFQPMAMLKYGLHKQGVEFDELDIIDPGNVDDMERAFRNGIGDYMHQQGSAPQQMAKDGIAHVVAVVGDAVGSVVAPTA